MSTSANKYDSLENLIHREGLQIETLDFHPELDLFLIILNTKVILRQKLSKYPSLKNASLAQLQNFAFIGNNTGVHWPELDEDLSLKGFLKDELKTIVGKNEQKAA